MNMKRESDIEDIILKHALLNALRHGGKARTDAVVKKLLAEKPELRKNVKEIIPLVKEIVKRVNQKSLSEIEGIIRQRWPDELEAKKETGKKKELPPLPEAEEGRVVTRFAPNPDFVLHLGSARPAILSYAYARKYKGRFILRFEDTDPKTKPPVLEAYELIREDLRWLNISWDAEYIQSQRMEIYYQHAQELIKRGYAYVCTHTPEEIRRMRREGIADPCSNHPPEIHLEKWEKMMKGEYGEGEAVLRIKTDPKHPDPSVRDWIAFRIIDTEKYPHPLVGSKYVVWPTYNFACAIDDHLLGVTHILRAKEHQTNTVKQSYIYKYLGWEEPVAIHFGRVGLEGTILSKSKIRAGIERGLYKGWDDPRLGTLRALRRRGILPQAIWDLILEIGVKPSSARISIENLHSMNRKYLEHIANRYMFVPEPVEIKLKWQGDTLKARIPYHPSYPERGHRTIVLSKTGGSFKIFVPRRDLDRMLRVRETRLLGLATIKPLKFPEFEVIDVSHEVRKGQFVVQWVPVDENVKVKVIKAEKSDVVEILGLGEKSLEKLNVDARAQFFRFGFVRLDSIGEEGHVFYYTHS